MAVTLAPLFSKPVFRHIQVLHSGAILAVNRRTVSEILRGTGRGSDQHFQNYHRVLNRAQWSGLAASRILLQLLVTERLPGQNGKPRKKGERLPRL
ncbi:MAG: transposase [Pyrinomonadaceae bacterium]|nr:transposase [Pyrinomonadaceae bacterium]